MHTRAERLFCFDSISFVFKGMYQCGPMSLAAIKSGNCEMLYDGPFVFAEVNADKVHWARDGGQWFVLSLDKSS
jgi:hypothetical protein